MSTYIKLAGSEIVTVAENPQDVATRCAAASRAGQPLVELSREDGGGKCWVAWRQILYVEPEPEYERGQWDG